MRLPTADGSVVEFGPNATLHLGAYRDSTEISASELYTNEHGLFRRNGTLIATWDELTSVKVEQLDGAATVALTTIAAAAVVVIAALLKSSPSSGSGGKSGPSSTPKASGRSAPNPSSVQTDPAAAELVFRTAEALANHSTITVAPPEDEEEPPTDTTMPLFSRGARRRANVRAIARLEGGACWPSEAGDCVSAGARVGVRLLDFFELTGGLRTETSKNLTTPLVVAGAAIHGESPALHWLALALGVSVAFDGDHARVVPSFAVRFRLLRGFWLGLVPVQPIYSTDTGNWQMASGLELTGEF